MRPQLSVVEKPRPDFVPTVLTPEMTNRLALTNAVIRRVRKMGFGIFDVSLASQGAIPVVSICVDADQSAEPLFKAACPGSFFSDREIVSVLIDGVRVIWVRPVLLASLMGGGA